MTRGGAGEEEDFFGRTLAARGRERPDALTGCFRGTAGRFAAGFFLFDWGFFKLGRVFLALVFFILLRVPPRWADELCEALMTVQG